MKIYIVLMRKWGDKESHHYIVGTYDNIITATDVGIEERDSRSGKYEAYIIECELNKLGKKEFEIEYPIS